jgi:FtsP/CotA-like multicopper oxidase with cupredoxin domain
MLEDGNGTPGATNTGVTRREFIGTTLAAGAAVALGAALPAAVESSVAQAPAGTAVGQTLANIAEIGKALEGGPVRGVIKILNENKTYLGKATAGGTTSQSGQMRYFAGSVGGADIWPPKNGSPAPGPTIRARVGDTVEITLLNQVDVAAFGDSLDAGEKTGACDVATTVGPTGSVNSYPGDPAFDTMPNCYHGSSTANLHYHGTHVSPNILGDNVFVQLRPSPRKNGQPVVDEKFLKANDFDRIFADCQAGRSPKIWNDLPKRWRQQQEELLRSHDKNAVWQGKKGLPPEEQLWLKDDTDIKAGRWPQYYVGAYPSCFQVPVWNGQATSMGQAPGTHWYHAHKHGSTALNLANGLAGAVIIEGDYDDKLKPLYNKQVVLVLQQYAAQVNLMRAPGTNTGALVFVNGQYTPVIEMQANEVQFWRIINACHSAAVPIDAPTGVKWVQTAQDGVQLDPANYNLGVQLAQKTPNTWTNATLTSPMKAAPWFGNLAPGNRVDMLVQAPPSGGSFPVTFGGGQNPTLLFTVKVTSTSVPNPIAFPPALSAFPSMPDLLTGIDPAKVTVKRELHFATTPGAGRGATNAPPAHTINGKKFQDHVVDQTMHLGATEEWTLCNDVVAGGAGPAHPFHIHVNPFQVTEILNPSVSKNPIKLPAPWIWWDNIAIPPAAAPPDADQADKGKLVPGYIKFLSRFVDYTGMYVLHCHILGHEDRGMMQLVQVISNTTSMGHR